MRKTVPAVVTVLMMFATAGSAPAQNRLPGTEEFGLSKREVVERIEAVETLISKCMRGSGFQYIAVDSLRKGMVADKTLPGLSEKMFIAQHGYGISTFYTGEAPSSATGTTRAR